MSQDNMIINSIYAPGIATYGAKGEKGERGLSGYSLYYIPFDINDENDDDKQTILTQYILKNRYISNNYTDQTVFLNDRTYQYGDLFLTNSGKIYKYENGPDLKYIGNINTNDSSVVLDSLGVADNKIYTKNKSLCILPNTNTLTNVSTNSSLYIQNNTLNPDFITLYNNIDNKKLAISFSSNNGFMIDSSKLTIDNLYVEYDDGAKNNISDYYRILTQENFDVDVIKDTVNISIKPLNDHKYVAQIIKNDNDISTCIIPNDGCDISLDNVYMITLSSLNSYVSKIIYLMDE